MGLTEAEAAAVHTSIEASGIFMVRSSLAAQTRISPPGKLLMPGFLC